MKKPAVPVTDHCVIRYMERVMGLDIEGVRHKIADDLAPAVRMGAVGLTKDGFNYRISNGAVVTVMPAGSGQRRISGDGGGE